jgi:hypothetical protein
MKRDRTYESILFSALRMNYAKLTTFISSKQIPIRTSKFEARIKVEHPETQETVSLEYKPLNEIIIPQKSILLEIQKIVKKEIAPKQWKTKQINEFIQSHRENEYKAYCEKNNDISNYPTWEKDWIAFILSVKGNKEAEPVIKAFVENLRRLRHNALCAKDIVEKENREQWPAVTVVRAFLENKLNKFKAYTESHAGEKVEDPKWIKRWSSFVTSLEQNRENKEKLKILCSKFMTAQRIKKYRSGSIDYGV